MAEMVVVIGIIAIVFTSFAIATRPNAGKSVRLAQTEVAGLFTIARLQARATIGNGRRVAGEDDAARVIIYAGKQSDEDAARYLRQIQVVVPDPDDPNNKWVTKGETVMLPTGVYVVPPGYIPPVAPGVTWPGGGGLSSQFVSMGNGQTNGTTTTASATTPVSMTVDGQASKPFYFIRYSSRATLGGNGDRLVLSPGLARAPGASGEPVLFTSPQNVRGFFISQYGAVTFLNDVQDF
jgi:hypothetical protein